MQPKFKNACEIYAQDWDKQWEFRHKFVFIFLILNIIGLIAGFIQNWKDGWRIWAFFLLWFGLFMTRLMLNLFAHETYSQVLCTSLFGKIPLFSPYMMSSMIN